jgi:hypothetical protein
MAPAAGHWVRVPELVVPVSGLNPELVGLAREFPLVESGRSASRRPACLLMQRSAWPNGVGLADSCLAFDPHVAAWVDAQECVDLAVACRVPVGIVCCISALVVHDAGQSPR